MITLVGKLLESEYAPDLKDVIIFTIDEVARYYWQSEKTDWNIMSGDFPNIAPPYPDFFMQYPIPRGNIVSEEGVQTIENQELYGFLFHSSKLDKTITLTIEGETVADNVKWLMGFRMYVYNDRLDEVRRDETVYTLGIDDQGKAVPIWGDSLRPMLINVDESQRSIFEDPDLKVRWVNTIFSLLHPCLLAISFLHTKNTLIISSEDERKNMSRSQKRHAGRKRSGEPYYVYHVLDIRPLREILRKEGVEGSKGIARAAHLRRGNFADYTEGRGLFGKHHGLFWRDSTFVPGKGRVDKEYNVHTPQDQKGETKE